MMILMMMMTMMMILTLMIRIFEYYSNAIRHFQGIRVVRMKCNLLLSVAVISDLCLMNNVRFNVKLGLG